jgi:predicted MFS family arabinose efflux permease
VAIPFFLSWGLTHFSLKTILRAWGVMMAVSLGSLLVFIKPRVPVTISSTEQSTRRFDFKFALSPAFLALQAGNTLQGMGYFIPGIYLPSYAQALGMDKATTTATVSLLNVMGVFGCIAVGLLVDRFHVTTVLWLLSAGSLLSVIFLWGFSSNAQTLLCFSALYGFFAGPFTTTYTGVVKETRKQVPGAEHGLIMGMLCIGRGIGSIAAGPISERLLKHGGSNSGFGSGYDSQYESLILFTGICVALGGISFGAKRLGWM